MVRNTKEIEIDGKIHGFKNGTLAIAIACREAKAKSVQELLKMLSDSDSLAVLALFYGAYIQHSGDKSFTMDNMSDLFEEMGVEKASEVSKVLLESFIPKNVPAPESGAK
jgi:hypothetical protein